MQSKGHVPCVEMWAVRGSPGRGAPGGGKYFVKPTVFTGVNNKMRIAQEEVFGPVLSVIKFKDEEEAVAIANDIAYGLGAGIWTQSVKRAHSVARRIRAGTVWVNTYRAVSFLMPLGGYKASGLGRENGAEAVEGYLQTKSVWINNGPGGGNPFVMKTAPRFCRGVSGPSQASPRVCRACAAPSGSLPAPSPGTRRDRRARPPSSAILPGGRLARCPLRGG